MNSIRMLKICIDSVLKFSELTLKLCIDSGKFSTEWKKANVGPVHKKWQTTNRKLSPDFVAVCLL